MYNLDLLSSYLRKIINERLNNAYKIDIICFEKETRKKKTDSKSTDIMMLQ